MPPLQPSRLPLTDLDDPDNDILDSRKDASRTFDGWLARERLAAPETTLRSTCITYAQHLRFSSLPADAPLPELQQTHRTCGLSQKELLTSSRFEDFVIGNGEDIIRRICAAVLAEAREEVLFATCFLSPKSTSMTVLRETLSALEGQGRKVRVRIGFSSVSAVQRLTHTARPEGKTWAWEKLAKLGLVEAGRGRFQHVDLEVKSLFFNPVSVMHSKFVIVDRKLLLLPSCNVSWEEWMECLSVYRGHVVRSLLCFWESTWGNVPSSLAASLAEPSSTKPNNPTLFLPHPHSRSLHVSLPLPSLPCLPSSPSNATPLYLLNPQYTFLTTLLRSAQTDIYIHTPNLTFSPMADEILAALKRGVSVTLVTCRDMMKVEQLGTAGRTTESCVKGLLKRARAVASEASPGRLGICWYKGREGTEDVGRTVKTHVKCVVVDGAWTVLGSCNFDRASFVTSQEVSVVTWSAEVAERVRSALWGYVQGHVEEEKAGVGSGGL